jgi:hypothetical protein
MIYHLWRSLSEEEVWSTICDFPPDNAPRTDVFIGRFNCASWGNIKEDMSLALDAVHRSYVFKFKLLNTTTIMLLLKKVDALQVKDYQYHARFSKEDQVLIICVPRKSTHTTTK